MIFRVLDWRNFVFGVYGNCNFDFILRYRGDTHLAIVEMCHIVTTFYKKGRECCTLLLCISISQSVIQVYFKRQWSIEINITFTH